MMAPDHITAVSSVKTMGSVVKRTLVAWLLLSAVLLAAPFASAQRREQTAPPSVEVFYDALNAAPGKDVAGLLMKATTLQWVSCGTNEVCGAREQVIAAIAGRHKAIPDLKWEIKEVLVSGNRVTVRGEATGTPAGEFLGVPHSGKAFKV